MFDEEEFDAREWVNAVFRETPPPNVSKETYPSLRILKLQTEIQQSNAELDSTCDQLIKDLPSVMRSIDVVSQEVDSLRESMAIVRNDIEAVEKNTAESMALLMQLDKVKSRLTATVDTLEQARQWEEAASTIGAAQHSSDIRVVHEALMQLQRFMEALAVDDDHAEERRVMHSELSDRLQDLATRDMNAAIQAHDADAARELLRYFVAMQRAQAALDLYKSASQQSLTSVELSSGGETPLHTAVARYFEDIAGVLQKEEEFCERVFEPMGHHPLADVTSVFFPTVAATLKNALKTSLPQAPLLLPEAAACLEAAEKGITILPNPTPETARTILRAFTPYQTKYAEHLYFHMRAKVERLPPIPSLPSSIAADTGQTSDQSGAGGGRGGDTQDKGHEDEGEEDTSPIAGYVRRLSQSWTEHWQCISALVADDAHDTCARLTGCGAADGVVSALARISKYVCTAFHKRVTQVANAAGKSGSPSLPWPVVEPLFALLAQLGAFVSDLAERETALRRLVLEHRGGQVEEGGQGLVFLEEDVDTIAEWTQRRATDGHPSLLHDHLREDTIAQRDAAAFVRSCLKGLPLFDATRQEVFKLNDSLHTTIVSLLLRPVDMALHPVPTLDAWTRTQHDVQTLSFVNKIAGDLETLAENFHNLDDRGLLLTAAQQCSIAPFPSLVESQAAANGEDDPQAVAESVWLGCATTQATHRVAEAVYRIRTLTEAGRSLLCDNISILCNAVLEIGDVDEALSTLNEMLRTGEEEVLSQMQALAETHLAAATYHAARLRGLVEDDGGAPSTRRS